MKALSGTGMAISLVSAFLILALLAELYYLLYWKKKDCTQDPHILLDATAAVKTLNPREIRVGTRVHSAASDEEAGVDAELMKLHGLAGPPRFLFTIREEVEAESASRSLRDLLVDPPSTPPRVKVSEKQ